MKKNIVDFITLGCSKNLVDSERLISQFMANGYTVHHNRDKVQGEIVVLNTCGFIADAQQEGIDTILSLVEKKKNMEIGKVYVMGCLSERFMDELKQEIPEVDAYYGKFNWKQLISDIGKSYYNDAASTNRTLTTPKHYAYLKLSEGCNRSCSYCAIPIITGKHISRNFDEIIDEAKMLIDNGVKELQLIAQDLTFYGLDKYKKNRLAELLYKLSDINGLEWMRLHYAYPTDFPLEILDVMREKSNICNYMDIALQHISDNMLQKMRRNISKDQTYRLLEEMRSRVPNIHIRTTLMTGHPGETQKDFEELMQFIKDIRFERLGAFVYSHEEGTFAAKNYQDDIPLEVKQARLEEIMAEQELIASEINQNKLNSTLKVIVDRKEGDYYIARSEYDSPEVDQEVLLHKDLNPRLTIGNFYDAEIIDVANFDLFAKVVKRK